MPIRVDFRRRGLAVSVVVCIAAGCGGEAPAPAPPPPPAPTSAPTAATEAPSAAPTAAPSASAAAQADTAKPATSGRPPVIKTGDTEVADTFGTSPGARLELGDRATLRIPEGALSEATNIVFRLDPKGKSGGAPIGKIYSVIPVIPPSVQPVKLQSAGPPFELVLPTAGRKDANLAVGEIAKDDKGREKVTWTIYAPTKVDDIGSHYELPMLVYSYLHATSKAPSAPKP